MSNCPACQAETDGADRFCRSCGNELDEVPEEQAYGDSFCGECGASIDEDAIFCGECGAKVSVEGKPATATAQKAKAGKQPKKKLLWIKFLIYILALVIAAIILTVIVESGMF